MSDVRFDPEVLQQGISVGPRGGVFGDGKNYRCYSCGHCWEARERWLWWPVSFCFFWTWKFAVWGVQMDSDRIDQKTFARIVAIGWLRIRFGYYERAPHLKSALSSPEAKAGEGR